MFQENSYLVSPFETVAEAGGNHMKARNVLVATLLAGLMSVAFAAADGMEAHYSLDAPVLVGRGHMQSLGNLQGVSGMMHWADNGSLITMQEMHERMDERHKNNQPLSGRVAMPCMTGVQ